RQQATGNRQQATGNRQQATGNRQQATGNRQQATGNYTHLLNNSVYYTFVFSLKKSKNNPYLSGIKPYTAFYISMSLTYFRP
ncbi:MAG: hypothetical protein LBU85_06095, partial [Treponema sp.]|nr:hypothetical protein [Treponema sp.]